MKRVTSILLALTFILLLVPSSPWADETPIQRVIRQPETWEGEIRVDGVVIVSKEGNLNITPGTRVIFAKRDDDGDGIGDSELRIEGTLEVTGEEFNPVVFTSGAQEPAPADWKYIMINHADGVSIKKAVVEFAYSGIQVHYTRGHFSGIVSRYNVDGFRFSTAPVTLENSLLTENVNGIRYEERGAGAMIMSNRISRNRTGVFAVIKCKGLTTFKDNQIDANEDYAVKMGIRQRDDVPMKGNYWGSGDALEISGSFYDGRREPGLGKVMFEPYLEEPPRFGM